MCFPFCPFNYLIFFVFFIRFWSGLRQMAWFNKDYLISTLHSLLQNTSLMSLYMVWYWYGMRSLHMLWYTKSWRYGICNLLVWAMVRLGTRISNHCYQSENSTAKILLLIIKLVMEYVRATPTFTTEHSSSSKSRKHHKSKVLLLEELVCRHVLQNTKIKPEGVDPYQMETANAQVRLRSLWDCAVSPEGSLFVQLMKNLTKL